MGPRTFLSRDLARIRCDLEVNIDFETLKRGEPDRAKLHDVFSRLEFASLMQEYLPEAPAVAREYRIAASGDEIKAFVRGGAPIAIWVEPKTADGFDDLLGVSLSVKPTESLIVLSS